MPIHGSEFSGKLYPSGEFGIVRNRTFALARTSQREKTVDEEWSIQCLAVHGLQECLDFAKGNTALGEVSVLCEAGEGAVALGSSLRPNSHNAARGDKGITSHGKKYVRSGAALLEGRFFKKCLSFLTLTVPSIGQAQWKELCEKWHEVVRQYIQWLSRKLSACGLFTGIVSVTEIQEERTSRTGEPALHLHMLFQGRKSGGQWKISPATFRNAWEKIVRNVVKDIPESISFSSSEEVRAVKKSAVGYLGKYMSKGVAALTSMKERDKSLVVPHTWWNMNKAMRDWVKREIVSIPQEICEMIVNGVLLGERDLIPWFKKIEIESVEGWKVVVGIMGRTSKEFQEFVKSYSKELRKLK